MRRDRQDKLVGMNVRGLIFSDMFSKWRWAGLSTGRDCRTLPLCVSCDERASGQSGQSEEMLFSGCRFRSEGSWCRGFSSWLYLDFGVLSLQESWMGRCCLLGCLIYLIAWDHSRVAVDRWSSHLQRSGAPSFFCSRRSLITLYAQYNSARQLSTRRKLSEAAAEQMFSYPICNRKSLSLY